MSLYQNFDLTNEFNVLRLICGLFLLPHFFAKAGNLQFTYQLYRDFRLYPPKAWVFSCLAIEAICATGMVLAIHTRYVALLEAVWRHSGGKWLWNIGGYEYCVFWAICCTVVAIHG